MRSAHGGPNGPSRSAGGRLIVAALGIAAAVLAQALLQRAGLDFTGALLIAIAVLLGGWLLNAHARMPGLPLIVAGIMALTVLLTSLIDSATTAISGGTVFVALMLSAVARSWGVGLAVAVILATAQLIAALL